MDNLIYYNQFKSVPQEAKKAIGGGRLKGMTDINPMWRIKRMTEVYGPVGIGWYYTVEKQWIEKGDGVEQKAFCNINLYFKHNGEWSMAIPGTGGSDFVTQEKNGAYTSDECFKMALTDALSVAMKSLGIAADVYFEKDRTKYDKSDDAPQDKPQQTPSTTITEKQVNRLLAIAKSKGFEKPAVEKEAHTRYKVTSFLALTKAQYDELVKVYEA